MSFKQRSLDYLLFSLVVVSSVVFSLAVGEFFLQILSGRIFLPLDGTQNGLLYTWGHPVINNSQGFREREFVFERKNNVFRVVVLGDSLTWGAGIKIGDRYTEILQSELESILKIPVEVFNLGLPFTATDQEAKIAERYLPLFQPDIVIIGFCYNDTQPRQQDWSLERESFYFRNLKLFWFVHGLTELGLKEIGGRLQQILFLSAEWNNKIPTWFESLNRTYQPDSLEWQRYSIALRNIFVSAMQHTKLKIPVFAVLNSGITSTSIALDYHTDLDSLLLKWYSLAATEAKKIGFHTIDFVDEIKKLPPHTILRINSLDGHPTQELNRLYGKKLAIEIANYKVNKK